MRSPDKVATLRLGTRGSQLALWQARRVADRIAETGGPACEIVIIKTSGDQLQDAPLSTVGGKRLFVKEIEDALLNRHIDLAVHSSKDMPAVLPDGLAIAGVLPRENPLDAVLLPFGANGSPSSNTTGTTGTTVVPGLTDIEDLLTRLGQTPAIGTGSVRRIAQLTRVWPNARFMPIRGNLDTRLRKLDNGEYDALVLASAGLRRLGFASRISLELPMSACVPSPGQGIVAVEIRDEGDDSRALRQVVARFSDPAAAAALHAERALVAALGGGCQTPIGALASPIEGEVLDLVAAVVAIDGSRAVRGHGRGSFADAADLGSRVGAQLMAEGAGDILLDAQHASGHSS